MRIPTPTSSIPTRTSSTKAGARCEPYFKPDWSPELFLSYMYTCHLMVVRRSLVEEVGGFRSGFEGAQDYDLLLRLMEKTDRAFITFRACSITGARARRRRHRQARKAVGARGRPSRAGGLRKAVWTGSRGVPGPHPGMYRVRRSIQKRAARVSIVIPTTGRPHGSRAICWRVVFEASRRRHGASSR